MSPVFICLVKHQPRATARIQRRCFSGPSPKRKRQQIFGKEGQVNTLPKAKSKTRSKQNKDMHTCSSVYSERGVPLPVLTSGGE